MFFIEYEKGNFIDAEQVNWVSVKYGVVFTLTARNEDILTVSEDIESHFVNNLQAINRGYDSIENVYNDNRDK